MIRCFYYKAETAIFFHICTWNQANNSRVRDEIHVETSLLVFVVDQVRHTLHCRCLASAGHPWTVHCSGKLFQGDQLRYHILRYTFDNNNSYILLLKIKRILSIFNDESTESFICLRRHIYMSHVLLLCISFLRVLVVLYLRVTCICVA
jgi:hypothetical protein